MASNTSATASDICDTSHEWWRGGVIYQVYPRSFSDNNNDGIGDLAGITEHMAYIKSLGVDGIWISPFFKSPMKDFGYDVSDYKAIDPIFGTMEDFDSMMDAARKHSLHVMIDLVLNHTSVEHPWFRESCSSRNNPKADWFVWADPKPDGSPPNNWLSIFGGSAWEWNSSRRQYYLHNFLRSQADLNFHNPEVRAALLDVVRFWLKKGVQGFRLDTVNFYYHDVRLRNNPAYKIQAPRNDVPDSNPYGMQNHRYDKSRPENLAFLEALRALTNQYDCTAMVGEIGDDRAIALMADYTRKNKRLHMAYSFSLLSPRFGAAYVRKIVEAHEATLGSGWPCWAFSNHDVMRVVTRWGHDSQDREAFAKVLLALLCTLRGSVCIYQGEELGLPEADVPYERLQDPYGITFWPEYKGRDGCRTPMPWQENAAHAGFSQASPWLPVPHEHHALAIDVQNNVADSVLNHYRRFIAWRNAQEVLRTGSIAFADAPEPLLVYTRKRGKDAMLVAINLGKEAINFDASQFVIKEIINDLGFACEVKDNIVHLPKYTAFFARINARTARGSDG
jgi:alpha-glucosidase